MSNYHSTGSAGRLGSFELHGTSNTFGNQGFAGFGALNAADSNQLRQQLTAGGACRVVDSLAAQIINDINRGNFGAAEQKAANLASQASGAARNPGLAICAQAAQQAQNATNFAIVKEKQKRGGGGGGAAAQQDSGASAGEVLGGIGSILGAVAGPLSNIFVSHQNAQLQLEQIKSGGRFATPFSQGPAGGQNFQPGIQQSAAAARGNNNTAIIAIVVGVILLGGMFMMMKGKKD